MNYLKYNRNFVMMEEQSRDFAAKDAPIKGYLKVETGNNKGAMRCVVQNLKYHNRGDYTYKLIFFGKKHGKTLHSIIGSLIINRYGNGETYFRFDPMNLDGKGNRYEDFSVAIVAAASNFDETEALHPILKGINHTNQDSGSALDLDRFGIEEKRDSGTVMVHATEDSESMAVTSEAVTASAPEPEKKRELFNRYYNEYLLQFCNYTCGVASYYENVAPFDLDRTGAKWKKIQNLGILPLVSPGAHHYAQQYKHFLFGAKPDSEGVATEYFFAVPGRFAKEEQPDGGRSGFVYWQPVVGAPHERTSYGYWIVAVDAHTGDIVEVLPQRLPMET